MSFEIKDASLKLTKALPNGAATVTSSSVDTGKATANGHQPGNVEFLLTAPALTTTELADTQTITYNVITSDNSDLSSPSTLIAGPIVQTGAGGVGAVGATYRFRLPTSAKRYVGFTAVKAGASNASTSSGTLQPLF
jgi:flagellar capping protein FliD